MSIWPSIKKALNSTVGPNVKPLDTLFNEAIEPISESLMIPKFTKAIIVSGSFTIPKDGTYKIIACGAGGISSRGGGGCAIDQRDYAAGDILTLTVSGVASAVCSVRGLSMTANGTTTTTGATASGGNVANHTGGTSATTGRDSLGCGAGGYSLAAALSGGAGGIIGGDGYGLAGATTTGGVGGNGGIVGGDGGAGTNGSYPAGSGGTGMFGGKGGGIASTNGGVGNGGDGSVVGGKGGNATGTVGTGGNGGVGGIIGGDGGAGITKGGNGGKAGVLAGEIATTTAGGKGAFTGMYWAIPFKEVINWTKGNAIIFIEEV